MYCEQDFCQDQKKLLETLTKILPEDISFEILKFNTGDEFDCSCKYKLWHLEQEHLCDFCSSCLSCCECITCHECGKKNIDYYILQSEECFCEKCFGKEYYLVNFEDDYTLLKKQTNERIIDYVENDDITYCYHTYYHKDFNDLIKFRDFDLDIVEYFDKDTMKIECY